MTLREVSIRTDHISLRIDAFSAATSFLRALSRCLKSELPIQIIGPQMSKRRRAESLNRSYATDVDAKPARRSWYAR